LKYYCNKCKQEYPGSPLLIYENPNEELDEGVILFENGDYKCKICNGIIPHYRKFKKKIVTNNQRFVNFHHHNPPIIIVIITISVLLIY
jgi:hypothetical protein